MNPIPDKHDLSFFAQKFFYKTGLAVEVGAYEGEFAKHNLKEWKGKYILVDTWGHRPDDAEKILNDKNFGEQSEWDKVVLNVNKNISEFSGRAQLHKGYSKQVATNYKDDSLDWVYIDAGHDYDNCMTDLVAWWPKLRNGGLFSGDDYGISEDDSDLYVTAKRYENKYSAMAKSWKWGTALALEHFCTKHNLTLQLTWINDKQHIPNWYIIK